MNHHIRRSIVRRARNSAMHLGISATIVGSGFWHSAEAQGVDYEWIATPTTSWTSVTAYSPNAPVGGPGAADTITRSSGGIIRLNGDRAISSISNVGSTPWTIESGSEMNSTLTAGTIEGAGAGVLQFRRAGTDISVTTDYLILGAGGGTATIGAAAETQYLSNLTVNIGTTSSAVTFFNVVNSIGSGNEYSLGLLTVNSGTTSLNNSSYFKGGSTAFTTGLSGSGGIIQTTALPTAAGNSATLVINSFSNHSAAAAIRDGTNDVTLQIIKNGAGTQTFTGELTHTGGTIINGGTVQIGSGGETGSIGGSITNNATLAFNRSGSSNFDGAISGTGTVEKRGSGLVVMTGANTYTGGTVVEAGTFGVTNSAGSGTGSGSVTVLSGATFGGTGIVAPSAGNDVVISGALAPGNLEGVGVLTFNFSGDSSLDFQLGSTLELTLGTASGSVSFSTVGDWLSGSGNVTLELLLAEGFQVGQAYLVFENVSTSGFEFANVTGIGAFDYSFDMIGNDYFITVIPEPTTVAMLLFSFGILFWAVRRKRQAIA